MWQLLSTNIEEDFTSMKENIIRHVSDFEASCDIAIISEPAGDSLLPTRSNATSAPAIFAVPLVQNPHFYGRENDLDKIRGYMTQSAVRGQRPASCLLHGLGGVGKTTIAAEYAMKFKQDYEYVFWVPSENVLDMTNAALGICRALWPSRSGPTTPPPEEAQLQVERLRTWLENTG